MIVSKLCFGALPMGPLQKNMPVHEGASVICYALEQGINFIDTADLYGTYAHIREGIAMYRKKGASNSSKEIIITTKSTAADFDQMEAHIIKALNELNIRRIPVFLMHASGETGDGVFRNRFGAFECLKEYKRRGVISAIGVSTHNADAVLAASDKEEIDVIFPLINMTGMGLVECTVEQMLQAIAYADTKRKGIYAMKVFAGGNLLNQRKEALDFVRRNLAIDSVAIGMVSQDEVTVNNLLFRNEPVPQGLWESTGRNSKQLSILQWCIKCGNCIQRCDSKALTMGEKTPVVDKDRCILCGYCAEVCPEMAIRFV